MEDVFRKEKYWSSFHELKKKMELKDIETQLLQRQLRNIHPQIMILQKTRQSYAGLCIVLASPHYPSPSFPNNIHTLSYILIFTKGVRFLPSS